jgi:hypothetical protein
LRERVEVLAPLFVVGENTDFLASLAEKLLRVCAISF